MNIGLVLGTLIGALAYRLSRKATTSTLSSALQSRGRIPPKFVLLDDKPDPIQHVEATVAGASNIDTHSLHLYVSNGTNLEDVELLFALQDYASASAVASAMQTAIQAWPHNTTNFPSWSSITVSQASGYLSLSGGPYFLAFGYTTESEKILDLLGFDDIPVTNNISLVTQSILLAERPTKLALYKWAPTFRVGFGDHIKLRATDSVTVRIRASGHYVVFVDGRSKACRNVSLVTGKSIVIHAYGPYKVTISIAYPRPVETSSTSMTTDVYEYSSPGILYLPEDTHSVFLEAIGAGGSSTSGAFGGAGASVSGFLRTIPDSLTITVGTSAGDATRITGTNVDIIAGGGGAGGTVSNGGSSRHHGLHGFPTVIQGTRLGHYATLQNAGKGGTNVAGGISTKGTSGSSLLGGSLSGHPKGGSGHYGGGSGGKEVYQGKTYYGGAGGGSSYTKGLSHVLISEPKHLHERPTTSKKTISGYYGNGGNYATAFGPGYVKVFVTHS